MFDKIYYINLERRKDRDDHMKSLLNKFNLYDKSERIQAVDGNKINIYELTGIITDKGIRDAHNNYQKVFTFLTKGGIGCALSHKKIWELVKNNNYNAVLV